jgi:hypothetical protein
MDLKIDDFKKTTQFFQIELQKQTWLELQD